MNTSLITTKGIVLPLCDVAGISEEEIDCEAFLAFKLSTDVLGGSNYIFVLTIHDEYHQIDVMNTMNQDSLRSDAYSSGEYMYETTLKRIIYQRWTDLRISGIVHTMPMNKNI